MANLLFITCRIICLLCFLLHQTLLYSTFPDLSNSSIKYSVITTDRHDSQNYKNRIQVVINQYYPLNSWELAIAALCPEPVCLVRQRNVGKEPLFTWPQTKALCNVASCWVANMAEVTHTNLKHKHAKSCYSASVKCKTLPPFRGVGVSLLFCLATKQNLEWPTFFPTPIPPPLASLHTHSAANTLGLNGDWKCEVDCPITRHTTPCWYQLPLQMQGEAFNETVSNPETSPVKKRKKLHKKTKNIISHEAMCLEYKQAVWDESAQWPSGKSLPYRLSTTSLIQNAIQLWTVQQK